MDDGSCVWLRPERLNQFWSYDFVQDRTHDGRVFCKLNILDEFTKEARVIHVEGWLNSASGFDVLTDAHSTRPAGIHKVRQLRTVYRQEGACLDRCRRRENRVHSPRFTVGKGLLRELQSPFP